MKILVSNIGSTSFKFRLFDLDGAETEIASGSADRIGQTGGTLKLAVGGDETRDPRDFPDHGRCIRTVLEALVDRGALDAPDELDAVAFKAVMAGDAEPVARVTDALLERMEYFVPVAPAHNPPYIAAMRMFREVLGQTPLIAAFEPGFHRTIPDRRRLYAVPEGWSESYGIRRYGFHGASHRYVATRTAELMPEARRVISCHLGGSSSLCAIRDGQSVANSFGLSPQSGLPQGKRVGELDVFALKLIAEQTGKSLDEMLAALGGDAGLAALSGTGGDMRDIDAAADAGDERAVLTRELFATSIRDFLGAYLVELGGLDAIAFAGGIGENNADLRARVLADLEFAGIRMDPAKNTAVSGEGRIDADDSQVALWIVPTNEELIVARQAKELVRRP